MRVVEPTPHQSRSTPPRVMYRSGSLTLIIVVALPSNQSREKLLSPNLNLSAALCHMHGGEKQPLHIKSGHGHESRLPVFIFRSVSSLVEPQKCRVVHASTLPRTHTHRDLPVSFVYMHQGVRTHAEYDARRSRAKTTIST